MEIKVGKGEVKQPIELWCPWCQHRAIYEVAKGDQPKCRKCNNFVPKREYTKKWQ